MSFLRGDTISCLIITILIGLTSCIGDNVLYGIKSTALRAISDNLTHALVGSLSWSLIIRLSKKSLARNVLGIILCFFISSTIDLDHFLLAKSWKLKDALSLGSKRGIFHCSIIPLLVWLIVETSYKIFQHSTTTSFYYYCWIVITAFLSHHIRDATRRGMWFGFLGSTPPIPYYMYLIIAMGLPHSLYWLMPDDIIKDDHVFTHIYSILHV